jgi:protein TonB
LEVLIRPDGIPDVIQVLQSLDPGLDVNAIECARTFRFRPAEKEGKPVAVKSTLQISFRL